MKLLWALPVILACSIAQAELKAVIRGPKIQQGQAYRDFHLDGTGSIGATQYLWIVTPMPDNGPAVEGADTALARVEPIPGTYQATLVVGDGQTLVETSITFTIPGIPLPPAPPVPPPTPPVPPPAPPLPPGPPVPHPDPVFPPGKYNIALDIYRAAMAVNSPAKVTEAHAVAAGIDVVVERLKNGNLHGVQNILTALLESNTKILTVNKAAWQGFAETMSVHLKRLYLAGSLKNDEDWAVMLSEASSGLKAVQ